MIRRFAVACAALAACGCAPTYVKQADVRTVTITWLQTSDPSQPCGRFLKEHKGGCAIKPDWASPDCLIVTPPADQTSDALLGEEVRHCFGWSH
jgi:hypothetical protein